MADTDDINDAIVTNATEGVTSVTVDGQSVTSKSISEQIAAARHIAGQGASARPHFGLRFTKLVPPGAG